MAWSGGQVRNEAVQAEGSSNTSGLTKRGKLRLDSIDGDTLRLPSSVQVSMRLTREKVALQRGQIDGDPYCPYCCRRRR